MSFPRRDPGYVHRHDGCGRRVISDVAAQETGVSRWSLPIHKVVAAYRGEANRLSDVGIGRASVGTWLFFL